jgi:hypothetical protein
MAKQFQVDTGGTLTTSLLSYFKLEAATDYYGSNDLTNHNSVTFPAGKVNNGANFLAASSQWLSKSGNLGIDGGACSFSFWVKVASAPSSGSFFTLFTQNSA